jgi:hypothetical protein
LTAALRREARCAGNPARFTHPRSSTMNAIVTSISHDQTLRSSAFQNILSPEALRDRAPAAFAAGAHERTSPSYTFISTARVLEALKLAGFEPVEARQARGRSPVHAIRLRRRHETIQLRDAIPELSPAGDNSGNEQ